MSQLAGILKIFGKRQGIAGKADFHFTIRPVERGQPSFQNRLNLRLTPVEAGIHREEYAHIYRAVKKSGLIVIIGHQDKRQTFQEAVDLSRHISEINGGACEFQIVELAVPALSLLWSLSLLEALLLTWILRSGLDEDFR